MALIEVRDFNKFEMSDRFEGKYLELLIDTKKIKAYHVHPAVGHSKAAAECLDLPENEINKWNAGHLVSAIVEIEGNVVKEVVIGKGTSLELGHHIHHTSKQLAKAQVIIKKIMRLSKQLGEVTISKKIEEVVGV